jgi:hypothetical protein
MTAPKTATAPKAAYKETVEEILRQSLKLLKEQGGFNFHAHIVTKGGSIITKHPGHLASMPDFDKMKELFSVILRKEVQRLKADVIIFVTDSYMTHSVSDAASEMMERLKLHLLSPLARTLGLTVRQDAIFINLESREGYSYMLMQSYKREGKELVLIERLNQSSDDEESIAEGTFTDFFHPLKP